MENERGIKSGFHLLDAIATFFGLVGAASYLVRNLLHWKSAESYFVAHPIVYDGIIVMAVVGFVGLFIRRDMTVVGGWNWAHVVVIVLVGLLVLVKLLFG